MKQLFTKLLLIGVFPLTAFGQTIVTTDQQNKSTVVEEFTGIHCVYCPDGHAIAEQILAENPGRATVINIHQGGFASPASGEPDFRTQWGNSIANQAGVSYYPSATVNRHVFPGKSEPGSTFMGRGYWKSAVNEILNQPAYLNMAVEASIDINTRQLIVHVEAYYTGDSPQSTNFLNVALMQNNTLGPQTGGNMGSNYVHMRRLVDLLTGQWGEEITTTTQGTFIDRTYTYDIPTDYKGVPAILPDMQVAVFMTETHQEVIGGANAYTALLGLEYQSDAALISIHDVNRTCVNQINPVITIQNNGEQTISSLNIEYSVNGGAVQTYTWTGSLTSLHTADIELPAVNFNLLESNSLSVNIVDSDQNPGNNSSQVTFLSAPDAQTNDLVLTINTDSKGSQTRWIIRNSANQTVQQGNGYSNNQTYNINITLPGTDCYSFRVLDTGGDGGASVTLKDAAGNILIESDGNYGAGFTEAFSKGALGLDEIQITNVSVYPNPSTGIVNLSSNNTIDSVKVYDITGRLVKTTGALSADKSVVDMTSFAAGTYVFKIESGKKVITKKVIIK